MTQTVFTNITKNNKFKKEFEENLKSTTNLTIASGYFGVSTILDYEKVFSKIGKKGACKILIGMLFHGGATQKQKDALLRIHALLNSKDNDNGVYISVVPYHGKIYSFGDEGHQKKIYVGSSNFSKEGIFSRNECSVLVDKEETKADISAYLSELFSKKFAKPLHEVDLIVASKISAKKAPSTLLADYIVDNAEVPVMASAIGAVNIKLRVDDQLNSSLNLYFEGGRKTGGLYTPRPWYEVEIGARVEDTKNDFYPISTLKPTGKARNGEFVAYAKDGNTYYKLNMVVSADYGKNIASSKESGGRATLGKYIKGKLEKAGVLEFGERISSETLYEYGKDYITFTKIDNTTYIIEF